MQKYLAKKWNDFMNMKLYFRAYLFGVLFSLINFIAVYYEIRGWFFDSLVFVTWILFCVGFLSYIYPWVRAFWSHPVGKTVLVASNALVLAVGVGVSNKVINNAIGFPPQDFIASGSIIVLICYPWVVVFILSMVSLLLALCFGSSACLNMLIHWILQEFFSKFNERVKRVAVECGRRAQMHVLHMTGGVFIAIGLVHFMYFLGANYKDSLPLVRNLAYYVDYQKMSNYPCINVKDQVHIHSNGIVSIAVKKSLWSDVAIHSYIYENCQETMKSKE